MSLVNLISNSTAPGKPSAYRKTAKKNKLRRLI